MRGSQQYGVAPAVGPLPPGCKYRITVLVPNHARPGDRGQVVFLPGQPPLQFQYPPGLLNGLPLTLDYIPGQPIVFGSQHLNLAPSGPAMPMMAPPGMQPMPPGMQMVAMPPGHMGGVPPGMGGGGSMGGMPPMGFPPGVHPHGRARRPCSRGPPAPLGAPAVKRPQLTSVPPVGAQSLQLPPELMARR